MGSLHGGGRAAGAAYHRYVNRAAPEIVDQTPQRGNRAVGNVQIAPVDYEYAFIFDQFVMIWFQGVITIRISMKPPADGRQGTPAPALDCTFSAWDSQLVMDFEPRISRVADPRGGIPLWVVFGSGVVNA
jgi:hypothetical protein